MITPNVTFQVQGGDSIAAWLSGLPDKVARRIGVAALKAGAKPMIAAIRSRIHSVSGLLARSLKAHAGKGDREGRTSLIISANTTRAAFARAKPSHRVAAGRDTDRYVVYYGYPVEFGHRIAGVTGAVPPHPFIRPGFDSTAEEAGDIIEEALVAGIVAEGDDATPGLVDIAASGGGGGGGSSQPTARPREYRPRTRTKQYGSHRER
jgi:hypothetical protein